MKPSGVPRRYLRMSYNHGQVGQLGPRRTRHLHDASRLLRCLKSDESADAPVELAVILLANNEYILNALATLFGQPLLDHPLRGAEIQLADESFQGVNIQCPLHCARSNGAKTKWAEGLAPSLSNNMRCRLKVMEIGGRARWELEVRFGFRV